jgi:hypothetical protein
VLKQGVMRDNNLLEQSPIVDDDDGADLAVDFDICATSLHSSLSAENAAVHVWR